MEKLENEETTAEKVARLLQAEIEQNGEKFIVKKQRTIDIYMDNHRFTCTLDLDISFDRLQTDGSAFNRAEIFLLPEEFPAFTFTLREHQIPFPTAYRQWQKVNPNVIIVCMESTEPPEQFAKRLSAALCALDE